MTIIEQRVEQAEGRIDRLEAILGQFMTQTGISLQRIDRSIERLEAAAAKDREEAALERRAMNKRWGELANKMGTLVEDIVAPSLRRLAWAELDCGEERFFAERITRVRSDDPSQRREFDALYAGTRAVLLNETRSNARSEDVRDFVTMALVVWRCLVHLPVMSLFLPTLMSTWSCGAWTSGSTTARSPSCSIAIRRLPSISSAQKPSAPIFYPWLRR
jgi:hypothetical protein